MILSRLGFKVIYCRGNLFIENLQSIFFLERDIQDIAKRISLTLFISSTLLCFFSIVLRAFSFFCSNIRVPAASSSMPRISGGFILSTFVIRPCIIRKCGLWIFNCTDWNKSWTLFICAVTPLMRNLLLPPSTTMRYMIWYKCDQYLAFSRSSLGWWNFWREDLYLCNRSSKTHRNSNFLHWFIPSRWHRLVLIVENNGDRCSFHTSLALFVDKILCILCSQSSPLGNTKHKAYRVEDVGFATAIKTSNRVEVFVKPADRNALGVGLETVNDNLLYIHSWFIGRSKTVFEQ